MRSRVRRAVAGAAAVAACSVAAPIALAAWTGTASSSGTVSAANLTAPTGLGASLGTCVANTSFQVNLSWNAVAQARGYLVYRGTASGGPFTQITGSAIAPTSYTNNGPGTGFTWQTTYWYVVKSYGGGWTSGNSTAVSITTPKASNCK
jgi:hypothetical protein